MYDLWIQYLVEWVMECLSQIQSIIITLQYHFTYIKETVTISFEWSERRKISSINQYQSYSSLSIHSIHLSSYYRILNQIQEWLIEVESNLINQSFNHSYYQILSFDNTQIHLYPIEWIWEKEDSSIQMIHTIQMNSLQSVFHSIDHNSLSHMNFQFCRTLHDRSNAIQ